MFIRESDSGFEFAQLGGTAPESVSNLEMSFAPLCRVGAESGPAAVAQYAGAVRYQRGERTDTCQQLLAQICPDGKYMTFRNALSAAASALGLPEESVMYVRDAGSVKRSVHQFGAAVAEMKPSNSYCQTKAKSMEGVFTVNSAGSDLDQRLSKGFVILGYDAECVLAQNSLGTSYGSLGYVRIGWDAFAANLIKCAFFNVPRIGDL